MLGLQPVVGEERVEPLGAGVCLVKVSYLEWNLESHIRLWFLSPFCFLVYAT